MRRATITVRGRVQKVGYRDMIAEIANSLDIGGITKNLPDGTVRIIAEAEKKTLENFIALIRPKEDPMVKVTGIDVKFEPATNEFEYFDIEYEDFNIEAFERIGTAATYLKRIDKRQDQMLDKQEETIEVLGGKIDEGFSRMDQNFSTLRDDYGRISQTMEKILESMDNTSKKTEQILEKLTQQQENFTQAIKELTKAILKSTEKPR